MEANAIDSALRTTLEDHRLSRGERHALREVIEDLSPTPALLDDIRRRAFALAREVLPEGPDGAAVDWLEGVVKLLDGLRPRQDELPLAEAFFSPGPSCLTRLRSLLEGARRDAGACIYTITDDRISRALLDAHHRGVKIRIVTDDEKVDDEGSDIRRLTHAGIPIVVDGSSALMHHKFLVVDHSIVATGSYNWTRSAADGNQENLVVSSDPRLVASFQAEFERLWTRFGGS